jgi:hypothetical protein
MEGVGELVVETIGSGNEGIDPSADEVSIVICFVAGGDFLIV